MYHNKSISTHKPTFVCALWGPMLIMIWLQPTTMAVPIWHRYSTHTHNHLYQGVASSKDSQWWSPLPSTCSINVYWLWSEIPFFLAKFYQDFQHDKFFMPATDQSMVGCFNSVAARVTVNVSSSQVATSVVWSTGFIVVVSPLKGWSWEGYSCRDILDIHLINE